MILAGYLGCGSCSSLEVRSAIQMDGLGTIAARPLRTFLGVASEEFDRFLGERAIAFGTVKLNVFTLELLLDEDVVGDFSTVFRSSAIVQGDNYAGV
jgi:hypothetical protein